MIVCSTKNSRVRPGFNRLSYSEVQVKLGLTTHRYLEIECKKGGENNGAI